jgi:hypothetical protein
MSILLEECLNKILNVVRKYSSFGIIKIKDEEEIKNILIVFLNSIISAEKQKSYNEGYIVGIKMCKKMNEIN